MPIRSRTVRFGSATDLLAILSRIESLYGHVLKPADGQERRLATGQLDGLQSLLLAKDRAVAEAQARLGRIGELLGRVVAAEERCRKLAPSAPAVQPRAQAVAVYGSSPR